MDSLLAEFINETRDLIQEASQDFLKIEENPEDKDLLNSLFRAMHTIKGSSGIFEISPLTELVHEAENVLDRAREDELVLTPEIIDIFLDILDQLNVWLDELEQNQVLGEDAQRYSADLKARLQQLAGMTQDNAHPQEESPDEPDEPDIPPAARTEKRINLQPYLEHFSHQTRVQILEQQPEAWDEPVRLVIYEPDENCFYSGDDPLLTARKTPLLLALACEPVQAWPEEQEFDPYVCNLRFFILTLASKQDIEEHFLYVADEIQIFELQIKDLIFPSGQKTPPEALELFLADGLKLFEEENFDNLLSATRVALELVSEDSYGFSALQLLQLCLQSRPKIKKDIIKALLDALATGQYVPPEPENIAQPASEPATEPDEDTHQPATKTTLAPEQPTPDSNQEQILLSETGRTIFEQQLKLLTIDCPDNVKQGQLKSIQTVITNILNRTGQPELAGEASTIIETLTQQYSPEQARQAQDKLKSLLDQIKTATPAGADSISARVSGGLNQHSVSGAKKLPGAPVKQPEQPARARQTSSVKTELKVLKIDQKRIDVLMDLVSELVVAKNALPYLAKKAEEIFQSRELARELKGQYATINRICEELQNAVMQIRMVPVSHIFQRFPRLVRDIARKLNKKVNLIVEGEDTRADKNVIEDMAEPLVHLIRNSLDHGLEPPEERTKAGKPEQGHIYLRAKHLEDQIVIEVSDDGRGINVEAVKQKAYEKGLIDEETMENISDQDALQLIFAPGLSTAREVSDVSGRGVGMDAVRAMVENVGGSVNIASEPGQGTTVSLSLPLSMAVTRILMIEVAGELFGVPIENVAETVRINKEEIHHIKDMEAIVLRNRLIPIYRLSEILRITCNQPLSNTHPAMQDEDEIAILIITLGRHEFGLVVDKFHEGIDIILKPLEGMMEQFHIYSGATLLGDGRVLLVLNPKEIVQWL